MIEQAFEVAAEFKFDVGQALINTKALQSGVDDLSNSATKAMGTLNYLASGLVARLGLGSGGLLTVLTQAVNISEAFDTASLGFANNITENFRTLTGTINTFNDRLRTSQMIMGKISDEATGVGLPAADLAMITNKLATPLANRGKLGVDYGGSISMAKNLMLASQNTGISPMAASESLYRALSERMPLHGQLFARLANTETFKKAGVVTQHQLQGMNGDKKIDLLARALETLATDADALNHRLSTIHAQFQIMKDRIAMVLRPIGDQIQGAIVKVFKMANDYLKMHGKDIGESVAKLIGNIFEDPKGLLINLLQMKQLGADVKKSMNFVELYGTFRFLKFIFGLLGVTFSGGLIKRALMAVWEGLTYLAGIIPWAQIFSGAMTLLRLAIVEVLPIFMAFLFFFQIISRAMAIAKVNDAVNMITLMPKLTELLARMKNALANILLPITMAIDFWAKFLAPLFETSTILSILMPGLEAFATVLEWLGKGVIYALAGISALTSVLIGFAFDMINLQNPFKNMLQNMKDGFNDFMEKHPFSPGSDKMPAPTVINNNHIEARFDMREQMEPDRIAFAVTEHLKNLAINPTQSRGNSLAGGLATSYFGGRRLPLSGGGQ